MLIKLYVIISLPFYFGGRCVLTPRTPHQLLSCTEFSARPRYGNTTTSIMDVLTDGNKHTKFNVFNTFMNVLYASIQCESEKSSPPKTFCDIFTQVKYISIKFCPHVLRSYLHIFANCGQFILIFNNMASNVM